MSAIEKKFCNVNGYQMAYVETGVADGDPIVFLHGNPTSSYLWRNIIPELESRGRCVAPDLIGMGDSDKLNNTGPDSYSIVEHVDFLDQFLKDCANVKEKVVLVIHDWGSALGFWWAFRNQPAVKGIVYMEAMVKPLLYEDFDETFQQFFQTLRTPGVGEALILEQNLFIEVSLPDGILRNLTEQEMNVYRAPFLEPGEDRRPMLTFPREVPINGTPLDVVDMVQQYSSWMATNDIPKLFINAEPGILLTGASREFARTWKNQVEVTVPGLHFIQEDSPLEIADAINEWLDQMEEVEVVTNGGGNTSGAAISSASGINVMILVFFLAHFLFKV